MASSIHTVELFKNVIEQHRIKSEQSSETKYENAITSVLYTSGSTDEINSNNSLSKYNDISNIDYIDEMQLRKLSNLNKK